MWESLCVLCSTHQFGRAECIGRTQILVSAAGALQKSNNSMRQTSKEGKQRRNPNTQNLRFAVEGFRHTEHIEHAAQKEEIVLMCEGTQWRQHPFCNQKNY